MEVCRITARGQKISAEGDRYLSGLAETLSEWASPEDEDAWRDLRAVRARARTPAELIDSDRKLPTRTPDSL